MKVKNIKIGIRSRKDTFKKAKEAMKRLSRGEKVKTHRALYFENLDAMRRVLTEKRLELLHVIKEKKPSSIYRLSKLLDRDINNVIDDLKYLEEVGLVELKRSGKGRKETIPAVNYDKIHLEIAV